MTMKSIETLLQTVFAGETLVQATLSDPRRKEPGQAAKVKIKPLLLKGERHYQLAYAVGTKELHENRLPDDARDHMLRLLQEDFKQGLLQTAEGDYQLFINKGGKASVLAKPATKKKAELSHNRKKQYLLEEGTPVPFLVELGVMNAQGRVAAAKYDKFRQINRFLEMIDDVMPSLRAEGTLQIIDFGCGKSYLTFALYHYLAVLQNRDVAITGLDLKADVIEHCSLLAGKLGYERLRFQVGDIGQYRGAERVDMVVTLHACDTATDAALDKAVRWDADVILSVPCCQHELFAQVEAPVLAPLLEHGILKERFAALATDSIRAQLLELVGYKAQILEFIDMEHTPKNLLIRAVKQPKPSSTQQLAKMAAAYVEFRRFLHAAPYLERALADRLTPILAAAADGDRIQP